mmetsp:Transcript_11555/g.23276  ORF Transcript_11555/g.23276 Transcript_11555/m.23276 type:complete len:220 (+) Transcript_11555:1620-2279(+)
MGESSKILNSSCWSWRLHETYVTKPNSNPCFFIWSTKSCDHRNMCWVVLERDRTTTGTPNSMLRSTFRERSRKLLKFDTHPTKAGVRLIDSRPSDSSRRRRSFRRCSMQPASMASSISVTPSCFLKSKAWLPTNSPASGPKSSFSIALTLKRLSISSGTKVFRWCETLDRTEDVARICIPLPESNASLVSTCLPILCSSPLMMVQIGSSYQVFWSNLCR